MSYQQSDLPNSAPFLFNGKLASKRISFLNRPLEAVVEKISGLETLQRLYECLPPSASALEFIEKVLDLFQIRYQVERGELDHVPNTGGTVVVANHPFGAVEGMILIQILLRVRPDVKILANEFLNRIPELNDLFFGVDVFAGDNTNKRNGVINNSLSLKKAIRWVRDGGCLLVFPAGAVSHFHLSQKKVIDPAWSPAIGRIARLTGAHVTPVYIRGRNSLLFQMFGMLQPMLRTAMLPRQFINKRNSVIRLNIGKSINAQSLEKFTDDKQLTDYLRLRTYALKNMMSITDAVRVSEGHQQAIAEPVKVNLLNAEVEGLPDTQCLGGNGELKVYYANAEQIYWVLREIGRLREISFRQTGEGSGKDLDLDRFDQHYLHLFVWNEAKKEVVCAYRMGLVDKILAKQGVKGLYTYTLFKYKRRLLDSIGPAIELGRSFVRPEYQRSFSPLMLLWKGITQFVVQNPAYHTLFGPVSISNDYATVSQQLLVNFLKLNNYSEEYARLVKARKPFKQLSRTPWSDSALSLLQDIEQLSELVSQFERDAKGAPILLRQYLKLGGTLLGFNVDNAFSDALDGLIMVDLRKTEQKVLSRYMGKQGIEGFLRFHQNSSRYWLRAS